MSATSIFVTSIGTTLYRENVYKFDERTWTTRFAPVATARLLSLAGARALVLATEAANAKWYEPLAQELVDAGLQPEPVIIADGRNEDEIVSIFSALQGCVPERTRVVLDVTYGLRHLPFVYLASLAYLVGLRQVEVAGIYYGALELRSEANTVPIIDVTSLFQLLQWYHALAAAREAGDWTQVATNLRADVGRLFRRGIGDERLGRLQTPTERLAYALTTGLPIEAGLRAAELQEAICQLTPPVSGAIAPRLALGALGDQLPNWIVQPKLPRKRDLVLTADELWRQLRVAEWYLQHGEHEKALLVMRECLVSGRLLASGKTERWLDYGHRKPVEDLLSAVSERARSGVATDCEKTVASLWDAIREKRNRFAHAGMIEDEVSASIQEIAVLLERCRALLAGNTLVGLLRSSGASLLITPVGLSPGVLYSGIARVKPDRLLIVTSHDAAPRIPEALERAEALRTPQQVLALDDAFLGYRQVDQYLGAEIDKAFVGADRVIVNVTGGTTVMQYAVERLAARARRLGTPVRRCALIDRRSPEEQRAEPYVRGEILWLDPDEPSPGRIATGVKVETA